MLVGRKSGSRRPPYQSKRGKGEGGWAGQDFRTRDAFFRSASNRRLLSISQSPTTPTFKSFHPTPLPPVHPILFYLHTTQPESYCASTDLGGAANMRDVTTCERCRLQKRRCDRRKPRCSRCRDTGAICSFYTPLNATSYTETPIGESHARSEEQSPRTDATSTPSPGVTNDGGDGRVIHRRNRMRLSCARCHRHKIKCDRMVPCGRCRAAGVDAASCTYAYPRDGGITPGSDVLRYDPGHVYNAWHSRDRGSSHWKALLKQVGWPSAQPYYPFPEPIANICRSGPSRSWILLRPSLLLKSSAKRIASTLLDCISPTTSPLEAPTRGSTLRSKPSSP